MRNVGRFILGALGAGFLVLGPLYLAILLLFKAAASVVKLVKPLASLLPDWLPATDVLSLLLVLFVVFLVGAVFRTGKGRMFQRRVEEGFLGRVPGYTALRGLTDQMAGAGPDMAWKPALAEIEDALVPAFVIEKLGDGRFTVFVPSIPTPFAGTVYVLPPDRVHPVDVPLRQAVRTVSQWGLGSSALVAAMEKEKAARAPSAG